MTTSKPDNNAEENVLAYAAITLCGNTSQGSAPEVQEILAWREGTLPSKRSAEILSHVANDPVCFQQWLDISEAESWIAEEASATVQSHSAENSSVTYPESLSPNTHTSLLSNILKTVRNLFQQPMPVYGGAFAAVVLAVLIAPLLRTGDGLSLQQQLDRSSDAYIDAGNGLTGGPPEKRNTRNLGGLFDELSVNDVERFHFQTGLRIFYEKMQTSSDTELPVTDAWQDWLAELPDGSVDCTTALNPSHCTAVAEDFISLGQWSFMNTAACELPAEQSLKILGSDFWTNQYAIYENIQALPAITQSQIFATLLPSLETQSPDTLCSISGSVLAAGK